MHYTWYEESGTVDPADVKLTDEDKEFKYISTPFEERIRKGDRVRVTMDPGSVFGDVNGYSVYEHSVPPKEPLPPELEIYIISNHPDHYTVGAYINSRQVHKMLTAEQLDRLTRGICEVLFRPRRKEFLP